MLVIKYRFSANRFTPDTALDYSFISIRSRCQSRFRPLQRVFSIPGATDWDEPGTKVFNERSGEVAGFLADAPYCWSCA
jgi:hypothetical protein